ncbi:hypothetical protein, partial [Alienimonas chondri]|uniref:hypothetical protein n=1 Tax=Alienimonas chondri TaxID=2681879 RepID=UPI001489A293
MSFPFRFGSPRFGPLRPTSPRMLPPGAASLAILGFLACVPSAPGRQLQIQFRAPFGNPVVEEDEVAEEGEGADEDVGAAVEGRGGRYDYRGKDGESDSVDARFPQNPERVRQLKSIARAVEAGDWDRATDALLFILGEAEGEVVRLYDGSSATVVDEAGRLFGMFPAAERRAIDRRLGGAARAALEEALASGKAAAIRDVAVRFPTTGAARDARVRIALLHLDRGEMGLAARRFAELLDDPTGPGRLSDLRLRLAAITAFARGGEPTRAKQLWSSLTAAERVASGLTAGDGSDELPAALRGGAGEA